MSSFDYQLILFTIPLVTFILFMLVFLSDRRRLVNGLLFNIFFYSTGTCIALWVITTNNQILLLILGALFVLLFLGLALGLIFLIFYLYWNARTVLKKERFALSNMLTLIVAILLTLVLIINWMNPTQFLPSWLTAFLVIVPLYMFYLGVVFYDFVIALSLYQFYWPRLNKDYIIILGSGLINGDQVPPLLQSRINRGILFYQKQKAKGKKTPKLLFSGGQGSDETLPEALAMQQFAIHQGIPEKDTLVEDRSVNTLQNMEFSKEIATLDFNNSKFKAIFVSNNYHIFRAGLYAKKAGLKANGIGAKTAKYFIPNAVIREFIAVFVQHKKRHLIVLVLGVLAGAGLAVIQVINGS